MESRWKDRDGSEPELLAHASRLMGAEPGLMLAGGGNSSLKTVETDHLGRRVPLMRIKPSGADMATLETEELVALRLDDLEPLADREALDDAAMVECVRRAQVDPDARRPSVEALLHAFLPDRWVLHSHADALLALGNRTDGEARIRDALGDSVAIVPYRRPGWELAMEVASARRAHPAASGIVLLRHGLITWGGDAREAYERHIELVTRCERALPAPAAVEAPPRDRERALEWAPRLRGALGPGHILCFDDDDETRAFVSNERLLETSLRGPATADHILHTGRVPCIVRRVGDVDAYKRAYSAYAESGDREGLDPFDPAPRVLLVPGAGMWTAGATAEEAQTARDIYRTTMRMVRAAGEAWQPIDERDGFHAEYWPLQARKRATATGELAGKVAYITGAASGIGHATARRFAEEGAHLVLTDLDQIWIDTPPARTLTMRSDVTDEEQVETSLRRAVLEFGGVDIVVSNAGAARPAAVEDLSLEDWQRSFAVNATGHFLVARAAMRVLRAQGLGGAIVFNASKNVLAPGKGFAAYSAAKAAETQLGKVLALEGAEIGVRVNMLHPDAVFRGTRLWSEEVRAERARAHGVAVEELEDFYARRNLLKRAVRAEDCAEAALFFASEKRSSRTTGASLTIDGGVKEAFPR